MHPEVAFLTLAAEEAQVHLTLGAHRKVAGAYGVAVHIAVIIQSCCYV